jgi:hypothetical protein
VYNTPHPLPSFRQTNVHVDKTFTNRALLAPKTERMMPNTCKKTAHKQAQQGLQLRQQTSLPFPGE